jgi:hypothetical protein
MMAAQAYESEEEAPYSPLPPPTPPYIFSYAERIQLAANEKLATLQDAHIDSEWWFLPEDRGLPYVCAFCACAVNRDDVRAHEKNVAHFQDVLLHNLRVYWETDQTVPETPIGEPDVNGFYDYELPPTPPSVKRMRDAEDDGPSKKFANFLAPDDTNLSSQSQLSRELFPISITNEELLDFMRRGKSCEWNEDLQCFFIDGCQRIVVKQETPPPSQELDDSYDIHIRNQEIDLVLDNVPHPWVYVDRSSKKKQMRLKERTGQP